MNLFILLAFRPRKSEKEERVCRRFGEKVGSQVRYKKENLQPFYIAAIFDRKGTPFVYSLFIKKEPFQIPSLDFLHSF